MDEFRSLVFRAPNYSPIMFFEIYAILSLEEASVWPAIPITYSGLVHISETLVFLICLVFPVVRFNRVRSLLVILLFVGPDIIQKQDNGNNRACTLGSHDGDLRGPVAWSISGYRQISTLM